MRRTACLASVVSAYRCDLLEVKPSRLLAHALGLEHDDWLSYDYIASDSPDDHSDVTEVT